MNLTVSEMTTRFWPSLPKLCPPMHPLCRFSSQTIETHRLFLKSLDLILYLCFSDDKHSHLYKDYVFYLNYPQYFQWNISRYHRSYWLESWQACLRSRPYSRIFRDWCRYRALAAWLATLSSTYRKYPRCPSAPT